MTGPSSKRGEKPRYDAFISYSRANKALAEKLKRALERFKPPRGLGLPARRLTVFLDQQDLVGSDYYESIEKSLRNARKLIVLCSPESAASQYVDDEIRRYLAAGGPDDVIPVLIAGLPNNEAGANTAAAAFSPLLMERIAMPLAIDYRGFNASKDKIDSGRFLDSWYSLLARLCDRERAEIEQRDRARRTRVLRIWASAAALLIVVLTGLTLYAFQQKNEAERQARVSQSNYLAAESRVQVEGDARLSFLLAKHSWQLVPSPAARQNLLAAFYRNSFGLADGADGQSETESVYSSPFYRWVRAGEVGAAEVAAVALSQQCPSPSLMGDEEPVGATPEVNLRGHRLALRFEGLIWNGQLKEGARLDRPRAGESGDEKVDPRMSCISKLVVSPTRDAVLLHFPFPRPHAVLWKPLGGPDEGTSWPLEGDGPVQEGTFSRDGSQVALLRESGTIELWHGAGIDELNASPQLLTRLKREGQRGPLRFSDDGQHIFARAAEDSRGDVLDWHLRTVRIPRVRGRQNFFEPAFSRDNRYLIISPSESSPLVFDARGDEVTELRSPKEWTTEFELVKDAPGQDQLTVRSEWYLKGLADESFVVRDPRGAILFSLTVSNVDRVSTGPEAVGAIAADGSRLFVSSGDFRRYHLYPLDADELIRLVDEAGFALTAEERARYGVE